MRHRPGLLRDDVPGLRHLPVAALAALTAPATAPGTLREHRGAQLVGLARFLRMKGERRARQLAARARAGLASRLPGAGTASASA